MQADNNLIHLALAFDKNFITPFYVLATSIFMNNKNNKIIMHVITTGINKNEKKLMNKYIIENNAEIVFYQIEENIAHNLTIPKNSHYTAATYYRLFFSDILSCLIDKVLYIDIDTIVIGDLSKLYNQSFSFPIAASADKGTCDIHEFGTYFNAGVMLINTAEWKRQRVSERAIEYLLKHYETIKYADQDALNAVLFNNWGLIENKFNLTFNDIPPYLPRKLYKEFLKNIVIVHYTGLDKPWLFASRNKFRHLYFHYMKRSPVAAKNKYLDSSLTVQSILIHSKVNLIEFISSYSWLIKILTRLKSIINKSPKPTNDVLYTFKADT
jgi:lipopolysaccharide biosynthesis glycosyltransferase